MTRRIWKYELPVDDDKHLIPAHIVHVRAQSANLIEVWSEVDPDRMNNQQHQVFGTGHEIPERAQYRGSVEIGQFVWHVFNVDLC